MMNEGLVQSTIVCANYLYNYRGKGVLPQDITEHMEWKNWLKEAYADPDFLLIGPENYFDVYEKCFGRTIKSLNMTETRGYITFIIRKMRNEYPPYSSLVDNTLADLMMHWIVLLTGKEEEA